MANVGNNKCWLSGFEALGSLPIHLHRTGEDRQHAIFGFGPDADRYRIAVAADLAGQADKPGMNGANNAGIDAGHRSS